MSEKEQKLLQAPHSEPCPKALIESTQEAVQNVRVQLPDLVKQIEVDRDYNAS